MDPVIRGGLRVQNFPLRSSRACAYAYAYACAYACACACSYAYDVLLPPNALHHEGALPPQSLRNAFREMNP